MESIVEKMNEPQDGDILKETAKYVVICGSNAYRNSSRKEKKFFCIGGPFDQEYKARTQIKDFGYKPFNNAGTSRHTQIWVHGSLIQG
jgi:hypothetical protein